MVSDAFRTGTFAVATAALTGAFRFDLFFTVAPARFRFKRVKIPSKIGSIRATVDKRWVVIGVGQNTWRVVAREQ